MVEQPPNCGPLQQRNIIIVHIFCHDKSHFNYKGKNHDVNFKTFIKFWNFHRLGSFSRHSSFIFASFGFPDVFVQICNCKKLRLQLSRLDGFCKFASRRVLLESADFASAASCCSQPVQLREKSLANQSAECVQFWRHCKILASDWLNLQNSCFSRKFVVNLEFALNFKTSMDRFLWNSHLFFAPRFAILSSWASFLSSGSLTSRQSETGQLLAKNQISFQVAIMLAQNGLRILKIQTSPKYRFKKALVILPRSHPVIRLP